MTFVCLVCNGLAWFLTDPRRVEGDDPDDDLGLLDDDGGRWLWWSMVRARMRDSSPAMPPSCRGGAGNAAISDGRANDVNLPGLLMV